MTQREAGERLQNMTAVVATVDAVIAQLFEGGPSWRSTCACR
jgi:hypothetical protein